MIQSRYSLPLLFTLALCLGCGDARTAGYGFLELEADEEAQANLVCDCYAQLPEPYEDKAACVAARYQPATYDLECIESALALDSAASQATFDCLVATSKRFTSCLEGGLSCDDFQLTYQACRSEMLAGLRECPPLPELVDDALDEC